MRRILSLLFVFIALATVSPSTVSAATTQSWTGSSNVDNEIIYFTGFTADSLTGIAGSAYYHDHRSARTFTLDLYVDNVWTNIWSQATAGSSANTLLSSISTPISFTKGVVSGLRLAVNPYVYQGYHGLSTNTQFTFDVTAVPLPAAMPLLLVALGGLGFAGRRKRSS